MLNNRANRYPTRADKESTNSGPVSSLYRSNPRLRASPHPAAGCDVGISEPRKASTPTRVFSKAGPMSLALNLQRALIAGLVGNFPGGNAGWGVLNQFRQSVTEADLVLLALAGAGKDSQALMGIFSTRVMRNIGWFSRYRKSRESRTAGKTRFHHFCQLKSPPRRFSTPFRMSADLGKL